MKLSRGEKIYSGFNIGFQLLLAATMLLPFVNVIAKSFSYNSEILRGNVWLWPIGFNTHSYQRIIADTQFVNVFKNSLMITCLGTALTLFSVSTAAYAVSRSHLLARKTLLLYFLFAMFFNAGMIPMYLNVRNLGLYDTLWAMIVPQAMNIYFFILMKSFFEQLPKEVEESSYIDGCNDIRTFMHVALPMSKAIVATIGLFAAVNYWNIFTAGIMFVQSPRLYPMQVYVQMLIFQENAMTQSSSFVEISELDRSGITGLENLKMAVIVVSTVPILCLYPFLQKHFVKGITLGAVKS